MVRKCIAGGCSRTSSESVSLHKVPKDPVARRKWFKFVELKRKHVHMSDTSVVCSMHFREEDYEPGSLGMVRAGITKFRMLKAGSVPSVHPPSDSVVSDVQPTPKRQRKSRAVEKLEVNRLLVEDRPTQPQQATGDRAGPSMEHSDSEPMECSAPDLQTTVDFGVQAIVVSAEKKTQTLSLKQAPSKARPKRRSVALQTAVTTKDAECQCNLLLPPAPISTSTPKKVCPQDISFLSDVGTSDHDYTMQPDASDPEYFPGDDSIQSAHNEQEHSCLEVQQPTDDVKVNEEEKFIVFKSKLLELFNTCPRCDFATNPTFSGKDNGTIVTVTQTCRCDYNRSWTSQPYLGDTRFPAGNILLSAAVLFSGSQFSKVQSLFAALRLRGISSSTFNHHQSYYLEPVMLTSWATKQQEYFEELKNLGGGLVIGGDGRSDSPGHCAKFGSYTTLELRMGKVIDVPLVQSNEVKNSSWMELEGLVRSVQKIQDEGLTVGTIVTDRHRSIAKWIRENLPNTRHFYDVWHIAKGLRKKLDPVSLQKNCEPLKLWKRSILNHLYWCASSTPDGNGTVMVSKWQSLMYHITDVHGGFDLEEFAACAHGNLTPEDRRKQWMKPGSPAYEQTAAICLNKTLVKDLAKLSPLQQTSSVEGFHKVILNFAPKHTAFSYLGMQCRLILAALHFNENAARKNMTREDGSKVTTVYFPKAKKGEPSVRWEKEKYTQNFIQNLMATLVAAVEDENALASMHEHTSIMSASLPPPLTSAFHEVDRNHVKESYGTLSRYSQQS